MVVLVSAAGLWIWAQYEFQATTSGAFIGWLQGYGLPTDGSADFTDNDADGMNNWQEWIAGTQPTNAASALRMLVPAPSGNFVATWSSVPDRAYALERATNLSATPVFSLLQTNILGGVGTTTFMDTNPAIGPTRLYRVRVEQ